MNRAGGIVMQGVWSTAIVNWWAVPLVFTFSFNEQFPLIPFFSLLLGVCHFQGAGSGILFCSIYIYGLSVS